MVNQLVGKAEAMIRANHFAGEDIQDTVRHLKEGYAQLRDLAALRKLRLSDAVESQQFFFKLNDTADWIKVRGQETRGEILVFYNRFILPDPNMHLQLAIQIIILI